MHLSGLSFGDLRGQRANSAVVGDSEKQLPPREFILRMRNEEEHTDLGPRDGITRRAVSRHDLDFGQSAPPSTRAPRMRR
jgi:hypothetical protein